MHQHHSEEGKELAVYQRYSLNYPVPLISLNLHMARWTVERVLHLWQTTGEVLRHPRREKFKRKRILCDQEMEVSAIFPHNIAPNSSLSLLQWLIALVESRPDLYPDEMQTHLQEMYDVYTGISTIWDALTEAGLTRKKVCQTHLSDPSSPNLLFPSFPKLLRNVIALLVRSTVIPLELNCQSDLFLLMRVVWIAEQHIGSLVGLPKERMQELLLDLFVDQGMSSILFFLFYLYLTAPPELLYSPCPFP